MEIRGQNHSSVETNDESTPKTRKRIKKHVFTIAKKKRRITPKPVTSSEESSCDSSDDQNQKQCKRPNINSKNLKP